MTDKGRTRAKGRVLIVENYDGLSTFLAGALREAGYKVMVAANAAEARTFVARTVDVVLVDAVLPGESGSSLAAFCATKSIPVVMMSGDRRFIENAESCGFPFLAKPFSLARLRAIIEEARAADREKSLSAISSS